MSNRYATGRILEYLVRNKLKGFGYTILRCAGFRPVDLIAIRDGRILIVECKTRLNSYLPVKQLNHILEISAIVGSTSFLVVRKKRREIRWFKITEQGVEETGLKELEQGSQYNKAIP